MSGVDANKTKITREVTDATATWLDERGFRLVETEVPVSRGWIADLAAFCCPTRSEAQKLKLLQKPTYAGNTIEERVANVKHWQECFRQIPCPITCLVEVKTSLQDFRRDKKWDRPSPVHLLYVALPLALARTVTVNERWGILAFDKSGRVRNLRPPQIMAPAPDVVIDVLVEIAHRRDAHTRYARFREFARQSREDNNSRESSLRMEHAMRIVTGVVRGRSTLEEAVAWVALKTRGTVPDWIKKELQELRDEVAKGVVGKPFHGGLQDAGTVESKERVDHHQR